MNSPGWQTVRSDAEQIWRAGLHAVDSMQLVKNSICLTEKTLSIHDQTFSLAQLGRIVVVGAGKAGAGMAAGFEAALPAEFIEARVSGWVNVPADCLRPFKKIHLHPARPAGVNEPTPEGVHGTKEILSLVSTLEPNDLCIVLISGGGSALLPSPAPGITLNDKLQITRSLSKAGASIEQLNTVRSSLSMIKGGGLLRACKSKNMISLIISDVVGDPLETIASGPTVNSTCNNKQAFQILQEYLPDQIPENVLEHFSRLQAASANSAADQVSEENLPKIHNIILGNNAVAVEAALTHATQLGYRTINLGSNNIGIAKDLGTQLIEKSEQASSESSPDNHSTEANSQPRCFVCGGETIVPISSDISPGKGGRNQEMALAALAQMAKSPNTNTCLLAAGTDGEDGPTDAAGAFADTETLRKAQQLNLDISDTLKSHDSYHFFQACDSLLITGPTHTNVMDLCIMLSYE